MEQTLTSIRNLYGAHCCRGAAAARVSLVRRIGHRVIIYTYQLQISGQLTAQPHSISRSINIRLKCRYCSLHAQTSTVAFNNGSHYADYRGGDNRDVKAIGETRGAAWPDSAAAPDSPSHAALASHCARSYQPCLVITTRALYIAHGQYSRYTLCAVIDD